MRAVYKYPVSASPYFTAFLPRGAELLCIQLQDGRPCLWALVDPEAPPEERHLRVAGTGEMIIDENMRFISTVQFPRIGLVYHFFEIA